MGVVYLAHDDRLGRDVAIKTLPDGVAADAQRLDRLRSEARIVAQLNHPNIAQIHHLLDVDDITYLILEYVPGRSLARCIETRLDAQRAVDVMIQVARGLESAHARGVVHRDLKPDNIHVMDDGTAKILDFGIALAVQNPRDADETVVAPERDGHVIGTPGYMAPEQCRGFTVDARADIFAFGCVLFECISGSAAFDGETSADRTAATLTQNVDIASLPPSTAPVLQTLLSRCLAKELDQRIQSMSDARVLLEETQGRSVTPSKVARPANTPTNLPRSFDRFVGRAEQLATVSELVASHPLVTLTGAGGAGKTRLAVELGRALMERFDHGVWIAECAATADGALAASVLAAAMGVTESAGEPPVERIAAQIADERALVILDNCEHVIEGARALAAALLDQCPNLRIVATSRQPLGLKGEHAWRVPSLSLPGDREDRDTTATPSATPSATPLEVDVDSLLACESAQLFLDRAREVRPGFEITDANSTSIAQICSRLDGMPLAIELAAARVKVLTPDDIAARLDQRFKLLRSGGERPDRHHTLHAAVDWSYQLLSDDERRVLRFLSIFAGGFTLDDAMAMFVADGADEFETLDLITALVDKSLLLCLHAAESSRYSMLETVRQYGAERLEQAGELPEARRRHLDVFADLADQAGDQLTGADSARWLDRLEADHDNMLEAVINAPQTESAGLSALTICGRLFRFWAMRAHLAAGLRTCTAALDHPHAGALTEQRVRALNAAGGLSWQSGRLDDAERFHEEAIVIARQIDDRYGLAISIGNLANVKNARGELTTAARMHTEVLQMGREMGNERIEAAILGNLACIAVELGDFELAFRQQFECLAIRRRLGDPNGIALCLTDCARIARRRGDLDSALQHLYEAIHLSRSIGGRQRFMYLLDEAGVQAAASGDLERAVRWIGACGTLREATGQTRERLLAAELNALLPTWRRAMGKTFDAAHASGGALDADEAMTEVESWLTSKTKVGS